MTLKDSAARSQGEGRISSLAERRQQGRRALRGTAYLLLPGREPLAVRMLDISIAGVSIAAAANAPPNASCGIRFSVPSGGESVQIETQVVVNHSVFSRTEDGFRIGLQFKRLTDSQASAIKKFCGP